MTKKITKTKRVAFSGWSDRNQPSKECIRYGVLFMSEGVLMMAPVMSGDESVFDKTDSYYGVTKEEFGIRDDSHLAWGFCVPWDARYRSRGKVLPDKNVMVDLVEIERCRTAYQENQKDPMYGIPYAQ